MSKSTNQQQATASTIDCPNCGFAIDVDQVLSEQTEQKLRKEFEQQFLEKEKALKDQQEKLKKEREEIDQKAEEQARKKLKELEKKMRKTIDKEKDDEYSSQIKQMTEELEAKSKAIKELNEVKAEKSRLLREKEEMKGKYEAEYEDKLNKQRKELAEESRKKAEEHFERKLKEQQETNRHLQEQLEKARKKAEQGSMRDQGEAQELVLEEYLRAHFPQDAIEPVKTGARGADILHTVQTPTGLTCGAILYESKNANNFNEKWIQKLKEDQLEAKAELAILVSDAKPADVQGVREYNGVWICSYMEFKDLCRVMRSHLNRMGEKLASYDNRNDKIAQLYKYLTSDDFKMRAKYMTEHFASMKENLRKERQYMQRVWAKQEEHLNALIDNSEGMFGSIQGIAGGDDIPLPALAEADDEKALGSGGEE